MPWFVLYTKSRSEKLVADGLRKRNIEVYCPLRLVKRKWSDRYKIVEEPLFRSYCFVNLEENERSRVFGVPGFVRYLFWLNKPAIVRQEEIDLIKNMLNDFEHDSLEIHRFDVSDKVRIDSGAFMHHQGEIVSRQGKKLYLYLESLGISISVDSSKTKIEKLKNG
ncbi:transcription termination/antitermination protein NusG [Larkinella bovis]|uniref:Transcription termination/antitermination protein NusG n=1 Tax=Larkinella bovis TaxID=683041 RepID=A0ABW0IH14_9BACT